MASGTGGGRKRRNMEEKRTVNRDLRGHARTPYDVVDKSGEGRGADERNGDILRDWSLITSRGKRQGKTFRAFRATPFLRMDPPPLLQYE